MGEYYVQKKVIRFDAQELIEILDKLPPHTMVVITDHEGNSYNPMFNYRVCEYGDSFREIGFSNPTPEQEEFYGKMYGTDGVPCIVLYPNS